MQLGPVKVPDNVCTRRTPAVEAHTNSPPPRKITLNGNTPVNREYFYVDTKAAWSRKGTCAGSAEEEHHLELQAASDS